MLRKALSFLCILPRLCCRLTMHSCEEKSLCPRRTSVTWELPAIASMVRHRIAMACSSCSVLPALGACSQCLTCDLVQNTGVHLPLLTASFPAPQWPLLCSASPVPAHTTHSGKTVCWRNGWRWGGKEFIVNCLGVVALHSQPRHVLVQVAWIFCQVTL